MLIEGAGRQMSHNQLPITTAAISHSDTASHARDPAAKWQIWVCGADYIFTHTSTFTVFLQSEHVSKPSKGNHHFNMKPVMILFHCRCSQWDLIKSLNKDKDGHATIYSIMQKYSQIRSDLYCALAILSVLGTDSSTVSRLISTLRHYITPVWYVNHSPLCVFIYLSLNRKYLYKQNYK